MMDDEDQKQKKRGETCPPSLGGQEEDEQMKIEDNNNKDTTTAMGTPKKQQKWDWRRSKALTQPLSFFGLVDTEGEEGILLPWEKSESLERVSSSEKESELLQHQTNGIERDKEKEKGDDEDRRGAATGDRKKAKGKRTKQIEELSFTPVQARRLNTMNNSPTGLSSSSSPTLVHRENMRKSYSLASLNFDSLKRAIPRSGAESAGGGKRRGVKDLIPGILSPRNHKPAATTFVPISGPRNYRNTSVVGLFGVPLSVVVDSHHKVPAVIEQMLLYIEETVLHKEGLFRLAGNSNDTKAVRGKLNDGFRVEVWEIADHNVICDLVKMYIRELPDPLLTYELYDAFLERAIIAFQTHTDRRKLLRAMIDQLPVGHKCFLKRLMQCLHKVQANSKTNKMSASNLGKVFGPNLLRPPQNVPRPPSEDVIQVTQSVNLVTLTMIEDYEKMFEDVEYRAWYLRFVKAVTPYTATCEEELTLAVGDLVAVTEMDSGSEFWTGEYRGKTGRFPKSCCTFLDDSPCT